VDFDIRQAHSPGLLRRLAAIFYDLILLFGLLMVAVAAVIIPYDLILGVPFPYEEPFHRRGLRLYLIALSGLFFTYFWVRSGQTLGMRAWRLQLVRPDGSLPRPRDAVVRLAWAALCLAPAGAGLLWMLFDRDRLTCYDRLSGTRPVITSRAGSSAPERSPKAQDR
jgi:uncharacterized RDD family membrane protein YckC